MGGHLSSHYRVQPLKHLIALLTKIPAPAMRLHLRVYVTVELTDLDFAVLRSNNRLFSGNYEVPSLRFPGSWELYRDHAVRIEVNLNLTEQVFVHTELHVTFDFSR